MVNKRNFLAATTAAMIGMLTGCQTTSIDDTRFIEQVPPGVSSAFVRGGAVWIVQGSKKKIVKIGNGISDVPFKKDGPYLIAPLQSNKTFYIQYSDGEVGVLDLPLL
jgi:hypothetical protein